MTGSTLLRLVTIATLMVTMIATTKGLPASIITPPCHSTLKDRDQCKYRVICHGFIRDVFSYDCFQGSAMVDLTLVKPNETMLMSLSEYDIYFLQTVVSLKIVGMPNDLTFLNYVEGVKNINLANNQIDIISGSPFSKLYNLEHLDLSQNRLSNVNELFKFTIEPSKLKKLILFSNQIHEIADSAFEALSSLVELDLSYNFITSLQNSTFMNLSSLEILKLNHNNIKDLNGAVNNLYNLKQLYLRGNKIVHINEASLKIIYDLVVFDISGNNLTELGTIFTRHWDHLEPKDCKIDLSGNQLTFIPNGNSLETTSRQTRQLKHPVDVLTELNLSNNKISRVEYNAFRSISKLINLNLSKNQICEFDVNTNDMEHLKYLDLSNNLISNIKFKSFSSMINLQNLDLSHNKLEDIPENTFSSIYNLRYVNMTENHIQKVEALNIKMFHHTGGVLDLSHNGLSNLVIPHGQGLKLTYLLLHSNNIIDTSLIYLSYQNDLQNLDLSRNSIQKLLESSLLLPSNLNVLDLSDNYISIIGPGTFKCVRRLRTLRLSKNKLESLEFGSFQDLSDLNHLDLSSNKIRFIDSKIMMDLKSLSILSIKNNGMEYLDYTVWLGHKNELTLYLDENDFSCKWLGKALSDYNNGFSKMKPTTLTPSKNHTSLEGISCKKSEVAELNDRNSPNPTISEEKLLVLVRKLLQAVDKQTVYLSRLDNKIKLYSEPQPVKTFETNAIISK